MRSSLPLLTLAAGLVLPVATASASTVSVPSSGGPAVFQSGPGASDVTSQLVNFSAVQFKDAAQALTAGPGCVAGPPVSCTATDQELHFGASNDRFRAFSFGAISVFAAGGNDALRTAGASNTVSGGGGDDRVWSNGNGGDTVAGDGGSDSIYSFEARANLTGGSGDDLLTTSSGRLGNSLSGGDGDDEIVVGGAGDGTVSGNDGNDVIVLDGPFGGYTADGGAGGDIVAGSPGADVARGGGGNDYIDVSGDGPGDTVDCGTGFDVAIYDTGDTVSKNCELRTHGPVGDVSQVTQARDDAAAFIAAMPEIPAF